LDRNVKKCTDAPPIAIKPAEPTGTRPGRSMAATMVVSRAATDPPAAQTLLAVSRRRNADSHRMITLGERRRSAIMPSPFALAAVDHSALGSDSAWDATFGYATVETRDNAREL